MCTIFIFVSVKNLYTDSVYNINSILIDIPNFLILDINRHMSPSSALENLPSIIPWKDNMSNNQADSKVAMISIIFLYQTKSSKAQNDQ